MFTNRPEYVITMRFENIENRSFYEIEVAQICFFTPIAAWKMVNGTKFGLVGYRVKNRHNQRLNSQPYCCVSENFFVTLQTKTAKWMN